MFLSWLSISTKRTNCQYGSHFANISVTGSSMHVKTTGGIVKKVETAYLYSLLHKCV